MIVDEFGKPVRQEQMLSTEWMHRAFIATFASRAIGQKVRDLRRSILGSEPRQGDTIRVRLPRRYDHADTQ